MNMVKAAIDKDLRAASDDVLHLVRGHMIKVWLYLASEMAHMRGPMGAWFSSHPHWLNCIAHVKEAIIFITHMQQVSSCQTILSKLAMTVRHCYKHFRPLLNGQLW